MTYKSSAFQYYLVKYGCFIIGLALVLFAWAIEMDKKPGEKLDEPFYAVLGFGLVTFLLWYFTWKKMVVLTLYDDRIVIRKGPGKGEIAWKEIQKIKTIPYLRPTLYWIVFKDDRQSVYFMQDEFTEFFSGMHAFIKNKNKELEML